VKSPCRSRPSLVASASAGLACLALLLSACGGSPASHVAQLDPTTTQRRESSSGSAESTQQSAALAFSRCMRSHGVSNFPDPDAQGSFPSFHTGVSKQVSAAANDACKDLLRSGGTGTPQQRQQKFAFALKVAECLRTRGFPTFPDPTASGQRIPPGIDTQSSGFQAVETSCERQARKAFGLP
jgi:hypothetical protein